MDTGLIVTKGKIELKTDGMLKKIQGRMTVKLMINALKTLEFYGIQDVRIAGLIRVFLKSCLI